MKKQSRFLGAILLISFAISAGIFWIYERPVNPSIHSMGDVVWWWLISSTTVGYGDISPFTFQGRIAGAITIITGIYCYTNFITLTAEKLNNLMHRDRLGTALGIGVAPSHADDHLQKLVDILFLRQGHPYPA